MNIKGIVTDSRGQGPIVGAKVVLAIGDREFATTATNNLGRFEHREDQNFPGQVLTCTVEKQRFQTAVVRRPLDSDIVNLTIIMQAEKPVSPPPPPVLHLGSLIKKISRSQRAGQVPPQPLGTTDW